MLTMRICVVNRNSNAAFYKNYYPEEIIDDWYGKVVQWQGNMSLLLWARIQGISSLGETRFKEYSKHVECNKVGLQNLYKSQPGSSCVDLPHIQVFILLNAHMDLVWLEALGCTQLQDISQFEWLHPSGWHHISDDLVDLVSRVQAPVLNKQQKSSTEMWPNLVILYPELW